jgi:hypothetical protein
MYEVILQKIRAELLYYIILYYTILYSTIYFILSIFSPEEENASEKGRKCIKKIRVGGNLCWFSVWYPSFPNQFYSIMYCRIFNHHRTPWYWFSVQYWFLFRGHQSSAESSQLQETDQIPVRTTVITYSDQYPDMPWLQWETCIHTSNRIHLVHNAVALLNFVFGGNIEH